MQRKHLSILGACSLASVLAACEGDVGSRTAEPNTGGTAGAGGGGAGTSGAGAKSGTGGTSGSTSSGGASGASGVSGSAGTSGSTSSGGASGSSGSGGANPDSGVDGAAGSGPVACTPSNVCDDFEAYVAGGGFGPWRQNGTSGILKVDGVHAFSGQQAVHFQIDPGGNRRVQLERTGAPLFPAQNNKFWGRVMLWASDLPGKSNTEDKNVHYDVIQASGDDPGEYRIAGMGGVLLNYEPHDCYFGTSKVIPQARWACWEWLYDGTANVIEFYIDGLLQARVESKGQGCVDGTSSVWDAPTFNKLRIGFVNYQSKAETTQVWMDDFAGGPARIGCPTPSAGTH